MTMLFIKDRIDESIEIMRTLEPPDGYYLAFSGGKDSVVLYDLAVKSGVKFDAHFNYTVDPPELVRFIREHYPTVSMDRSRWTMWTLIPHKQMPPTQIVRYCCQYLKERGGEGRVVLTGVKKSDSTKRRKAMVSSCRKNGKVVVNPMLNWVDEEVWEHIRGEGLPYCELYDQGFNRIGCIGCPSANTKRRLMDFERWPKFRAMYIRAFEKMLARRRERGQELKTGNTGEEVMSWWLREDAASRKVKEEGR